MAHWAELDSENKVLRVTVGSNDEADEGYKWLLDNLGGRWIQTSYNARIRGKFASIGDYYDEEEDIFISPQPYPSWTRDGSYWKAPKARPTNGHLYTWNENAQEWEEI